MTSAYTIDRVADATEWAALLARVESPHLVQAWAYGEAKRAASGWRHRRVVFDAGGWRPRRLVISRDGKPIAICQLLDKAPAGLTIASRLNRGPLFLGAEPDHDTVRGVYAALKDRSLRGGRPLMLAPALPDSPGNRRMLSALGYRPRAAHGWISDRVDLRPDEEQMLQHLRGGWAKCIRHADKAGVEFRVCESDADLEWIVAMHARHMEEKQFVGMSPAFLHALRDASSHRDLLVAQVLLDGERLGGLVAYRFGAAAEGLILWVGQEGRRVDAGRYLYWRAALELKRRGCRWFDLGGKRLGATDTFKAGMGGVEYRLLNEWWTL